MQMTDPQPGIGPLPLSRRGFGRLVASLAGFALLGGRDSRDLPLLPYQRDIAAALKRSEGLRFRELSRAPGRSWFDEEPPSLTVADVRAVKAHLEANSVPGPYHMILNEKAAADLGAISEWGFRLDSIHVLEP